MTKKTTNKLICRWGKTIDNLDYIYPKPEDARTLSFFFNTAKDDKGKTLLFRLEELGYDLTTLKFEIELKKEKGK